MASRAIPFVWKSPSQRRGPMAVAEGIAWVGDEKAAEAEIKCMVIND